MGEPILAVENLTVRFKDGDHTIHAVNGVTFSLMPGEVLGIIGESGSGKSVTLRALMRLLPPGKAVIDGHVRIAGQDILGLTERRLADIRGPTVAMIFQEPLMAFDPVYTLGRQIEEAVIRHDGMDRPRARIRALELFEMVQIPSARRRLNAYPHELSGGMRQRAMIALALSCRPKILLADEPTTALDVTVQIQILLLLRSLQRELQMSMMFVTHDVGVAVEVAERIAVMYAGRFVETGPVRAVIRNPGHPYTRGLLASTVVGARRGERLEPIPGMPPDLAVLPPGCPFAPRCRYAEARCTEDLPSEIALSRDHMARCLLAVPGSSTKAIG